MAPQQNSTLIDENLDACPSLTNIPEEICRYSPILPPKNNQRNHDSNNNNNNNNNNYNNNKNHNNYAVNDIGKVITDNAHQQDVKFVRNWEQTQIPSERDIRHQKHYQHHNQYKCKHHRHGSIRSYHSRRSRSISLFGVNSTIEQGQKEITIWLGDEARYVSGVTNKTTCNDVIKALIDDEIRCGNYDFYQQSKDGTASRDYSDYVITECWRGIERSYDNNMAILPVWKAWSRVHNEIRLSLKHYKDIQDPTKTMKNNTTLSSIRNYICKLLKFGKQKSSNMKKAQKSRTNTRKSQTKAEKEQKPQKDIMIILAPPSNNAQTNWKPTKEDTKMLAKTKINEDRLYRLSETRSTQRKRKSPHRRKENQRNRHQHNINGGENVDQSSNYLRKRKNSAIRSSVRNKLAQKNVEMNDLYEREYALTKELTNKCMLYKLQNALYTKSDQDLEISVGEIQNNIEAYAKEIIRTEHELLEVKNEIKQDISIVNNLKRLTLESGPNECGVPIELEKLLEPGRTESPANPASEQMQFVDNIYEFCDNNASMLV